MYQFWVMGCLDFVVNARSLVFVGPLWTSAWVTFQRGGEEAVWVIAVQGVASWGQRATEGVASWSQSSQDKPAVMVGFFFKGQDIRRGRYQPP